MTTIKVVTDSGSDIPRKLRAELDIDVVSLSVRFGEEELADTADLAPEEFWRRCASSASLPVTAAPAPGAFAAAFAAAREAGCSGAVCVTLSAELSSTYQSALAGAEVAGPDFPVAVIDSRTISIAQGLIAIGAAEASRDGGSFDEVRERAQGLIARTFIYGMVDTLDHLRRGGRIGGAQALLGSLLSIKPVVEVRHGKVEPESKQRTRARALAYLVEKVKAASPVERLAVLHAEAPDIEEFRARFADTHPPQETIVADIGPIVGTHTGPGAIGVAFQLPGA